MNKAQILGTIKEILIDILDLEDVEISGESTAESVDGWDSLAHINIVSQIEEDFEIKFTLEEISCFSSVDKIIDAILLKKQ